MTINDNDYYVTVCGECLTASCWHGEFMCDKSKTANIVEKRASELDELNREHPSNYSAQRIAEVTGSLPRKVT